jgi:hypothetical protein
MLQFLYVYFRGSPIREADKIGKKTFKKIITVRLMFLEEDKAYPEES